MPTITKASHQWSTRPDDERFLSLPDMLEHFTFRRDHSRAIVVPSKTLEILPHEDNRGLEITGGKGVGYEPTHWSFGQLASLAECPAGFLRTLPAPIVADAINYKLKHVRATEDIGVLLYKNGTSELTAVTGPQYGRIWNADIVSSLIQRFGDGVTGDWKVPGEFGRDVLINKNNTTLYAGDRDMFVFLADEKNRIQVNDRRNGKPGSLSRGFFVWNSEVGKSTLGIATSLFDYVCCNRIVWGAEAYKEIRIRHTASAPLRWIDEVVPVLQAYSNQSARPVEEAIAAAQARKVEEVDEFLANRFGKRLVAPLKKIHEIEENRPIESLWDVTTAATAYARGIGHIDTRVEMERLAGDVMKLATK
jgi:hypothetical protein